MKRVLVVVAVASSMALAACKGCNKEAPTAPPPPAASDTPIPIPSDVSPEERAMIKEALSTSDEAIQPVYPLDAGPPDALAERLCQALHELPFNRKKDCCNTQGKLLPIWRECVRMLTYAVRSKAVTLSVDDVGRCEAALNRDHEGCDWVGGTRQLAPAECQGILHGTLPAGATCRSTLECTEPNICVGVGPTDQGRCAPPLPTGGSCGTAVDPLAVYTRQHTVESERSSCAAGYCNRNRCLPFVVAGAACSATVQCAPDHRCLDQVCVAGRVAKVGERCGDASCETGGQCVAGVCAKPKAGGEACGADGECRGACLKDDAGAGVCGMRCTAAPFKMNPPKPQPRKP